MNHREVQQWLYDYTCGEVDADTREQMDHHLASCRACARELQNLRAAIRLLPCPESNPGDGLDDAYWKSLAHNIEHEIRHTNATRSSRVPQFVHHHGFVMPFRPSLAYPALGVLALLIAAVLFFRPTPQTIDNSTLNETPDRTAHVDEETTDTRVSNYLQKSRILLIGITNDDPAAGATQFIAQRGVSRDLIDEGRSLREHVLDERSRKLLHDLEKILIELSSLEETSDRPAIELIRGGIRQQNLLFKIRMAEAALRDSSRTDSDRIGFRTGRTVL